MSQIRDQKIRAILVKNFIVDMDVTAEESFSRVSSVRSYTVTTLMW